LQYVPKNIIKYLNIKFILSKKKNQVIQRNIAIKNVSSDFILQIDDDVTVKENFFQNLIKYTLTNKDKKEIVSALIIQNDKSLQAGTWNSYIKNIYYLDC
jgi:glycosyltransferase involved in cell wall biosynthesis